jgi:hypothetical protein
VGADYLFMFIFWLMMKRGEGKKTIQVVFHETTVPDIAAHHTFPFLFQLGFKVLLIRKKLYLKGLCSKPYYAKPPKIFHKKLFR